MRKIPVGQVLRHATDVSNVHMTLDRDVLVLAVKTHVKTTAFIMRDGDKLAFFLLSILEQKSNLLQICLQTPQVLFQSVSILT